MRSEVQNLKFSATAPCGRDVHFTDIEAAAFDRFVVGAGWSVVWLWTWMGSKVGAGFPPSFVAALQPGGEGICGAASVSSSGIAAASVIGEVAGAVEDKSVKVPSVRLGKRRDWL